MPESKISDYNEINDDPENEPVHTGSKIVNPQVYDNSETLIDVKWVLAKVCL
jgi:hypothetical protein